MNQLEKVISPNELGEKIKLLYTFYASLDENIIKKERKQLYEEAVETYGSWGKALNACGITKRKVREREKFILYYILKERYKQYGTEAIRPKNVHPEDVKSRIVRSFKTIKVLKDMVLNWSEEKVLYEMHALFLTGAAVGELEKKEPILYQQILHYFNEYSQAIREYNKRFGLPRIAIEKEKPQNSKMDKQALPHAEDLISVLMKLRFIERASDAKALSVANGVSKEEVNAFLLHELANAQISGIVPTEEAIKRKDLVMYFGMLIYYQRLEHAFYEIAKPYTETRT